MKQLLILTGIGAIALIIFVRSTNGDLPLTRTLPLPTSQIGQSAEQPSETPESNANTGTTGTPTSEEDLQALEAELNALEQELRVQTFEE